MNPGMEPGAFGVEYVTLPAIQSSLYNLNLTADQFKKCRISQLQETIKYLLLLAILQVKTHWGSNAHVQGFKWPTEDRA